MRSKKRYQERQLQDISPSEEHVDNDQSPEPSCSRPKRQNASDIGDAREKPCIICNHVKSKGDSHRWRLSEKKRAQLFISAYKFNKDCIYTRCLYQTVGDLFAADLMYHSNCMSNYILKFRRELQEIIDVEDEQEENQRVQVVFLEIVAELELDKRGYEVSDCRKILDERLNELGIGMCTLYQSFVRGHSPPQNCRPPIFNQPPQI